MRSENANTQQDQYELAAGYYSGRRVSTGLVEVRGQDGKAILADAGELNAPAKGARKPNVAKKGR